MNTRFRVPVFGLTLLAGCGLLIAQNPFPSDSQQSSTSRGGWRRADDPPPPPSESDQAPDRSAPSQGVYAQRGPLDQYGSPARRDGWQAPREEQRPDVPPPQYSAPPPQLTVRPGTFITVSINQPLSSDHNQPGDAFSATLVRPLVVDGVVVAQRGQTIAGRVAEAQKAGRVSGVSRLGVQLTELTLVDGQQVTIQSQLINRTGPTSVGRDAGAIAGTTALGAAIGAAADLGRGAAIGAGAGAAAGILGVLLTRGQPTIIYPEQVLTFRIDAPVSISTERAPQAFQYMDPRDYERPNELQSRPGPPPPPYVYGPRPYPYPYPYYYGPSFAFFYGRGFYGRGYYGRGFYRGRW